MLSSRWVCLPARALRGSTSSKQNQLVSHLFLLLSLPSTSNHQLAAHLPRTSIIAATHPLNPLLTQPHILQHHHHASRPRSHQSRRFGSGCRPNEVPLVSQVFTHYSTHSLTLHSDFSLTAYGASAKGANGIVGQLYDGQNRVGQCNLPIPQAKYSLDSEGRESDQVHPSLPSLTACQASTTAKTAAAS